MNPPRLAQRILRLFLRSDLEEEVSGDLDEKFKLALKRGSLFRARLNYWYQVFHYLRPFAIRKSKRLHLNHYDMLQSHFKIGLRNLLRNKGYSFINIGGLALGMAVAIMIGLWVFDEVSYNTYHDNYDRIARVRVNHNFNGNIQTQQALPYPVGNELRSKYPDFKAVSMASWSHGHFLAHEDVKVSREGMFVEPSFISMMTLKMVQGNYDALKDPRAVILSEGLAANIFGDNDPVGKVIKLDNEHLLTITGVYENIPDNCLLSTTLFLANIDFYLAEYVRTVDPRSHWGDFSYQGFVELNPGADTDLVAAKITNVILENEIRAKETNSQLFLQPMSRWHLFDAYENGVNTGGDIEFVWLFSLIGFFVLLLACINFMNLSTARSERRAREVGLRKAIGSVRWQLVTQFFSESYLVVVLAFVVALALVAGSVSWFNELANKTMSLPFSNIYFWLISLGFIFLTGFISGSYPAFYLSSFQPVKVLKGTFHSGQFSSLPRQFLVVVQFVVSVILVIGTIVVHRQIEYARNRPIGYDSNGLVTTYGYPFSDKTNAPVHYDALRQELLNTGAITDMAKSSSPVTRVYSFQTDFDWEGRPSDLMPNFGVNWCTHDFGKVIGLNFKEGRDFSRDLSSDTASIILNEAAVDFMGLDHPVGKVVRYNRVPFNVIGVVQNLIMESPYATEGPLVFMLDYDRARIITMKLNQNMSVSQALGRIEPVFKKFKPESLFEYQFIDEEFNRKFDDEVRIGKLATVFAVLAILISCLGLSGLASFVAEQRTKEIGIRKVVGASTFSLWKLLSANFVILCIISCGLAIPVASFALSHWLEAFEYRIELSWWIFAVSASGAVAITIGTVSYQALRAATMNPVNSLRSE